MNVRQIFADSRTPLVPFAKHVYVIDVFGEHRHHLVRIMRVPSVVESRESNSDFDLLSDSVVTRLEESFQLTFPSLTSKTEGVVRGISNINCLARNTPAHRRFRVNINFHGRRGL
jgi:hypothetical protein